MIEVTRTPVLEDKTSTGKAKFWFASVMRDQPKFTYNYYLVSEAWSTGPSGESKHLISTPAQVFGKNQGRANATTDEEQAKLEMAVKLQKKLDKGYHVQGQVNAEREDREFTLPMLAHKYADKAHTVKFPAYIQPKFNGIRCLYDGKKFWSRGGKELLPEVTKHLQFVTQGMIVDGELILPNPYTFQETISAIKKYRPISEKLIYRVYDLAETGMDQYQRLEVLGSLVSNIYGAFNAKFIMLAEAHQIKSEAEIKPWHDKFVAKGFEGAIVRTKDGKYTPGHRSSGLLKVKEMTTDEFKIVSVLDGVGKDAGLAIFECVTPKGLPFRVRPEGTQASRREMFLQGSSYIGKPLTVRYQTLSDTGVPIFPIGEVVRDYE